MEVMQGRQVSVRNRPNLHGSKFTSKACGPYAYVHDEAQNLKVCRAFRNLERSTTVRAGLADTTTPLG